MTESESQSPADYEMLNAWVATVALSTYGAVGMYLLGKFPDLWNLAFSIGFGLTWIYSVKAWRYQLDPWMPVDGN